MPDTRKTYAFQLRVAVSYYCNQLCKHCYVPELNRTGYQKLLEASQLSLDEITDFLDVLKRELYLQKISVTGGEPLLKRVWPRTRTVMRHALKSGLDVQLNTSGSGQIRAAEVIEAAGDHLDQLIFQVSLDGIDERHVDEFRGSKGAMMRAMRTIREGVERGAYMRVRYTMTRENHSDAVPCFDLAQEIGASQFVIKPMFSAGAARDNGDLVTSGDIVQKIQEELVERSVGSRMQLDFAQPVFVKAEDFPPGANVNIIHCACGHGASYLSPTGDIYPCMYLAGAPGEDTRILGNIRDPRFDFIQHWRRRNTFFEFREAEAEGNCTAQNILSGSTGDDVELRPS